MSFSFSTNELKILFFFVGSSIVILGERIRDYRLRSIASICYSVIEGDLDMIICFRVL